MIRGQAEKQQRSPFQQENARAFDAGGFEHAIGPRGRARVALLPVWVTLRVLGQHDGRLCSARPPVTARSGLLHRQHAIVILSLFLENTPRASRFVCFGLGFISCFRCHKPGESRQANQAEIAIIYVYMLRLCMQEPNLEERKWPFLLSNTRFSIAIICPRCSVLHESRRTEGSGPRGLFHHRLGPPQ